MEIYLSVITLRLTNKHFLQIKIWTPKVQVSADNTELVNMLSQRRKGWSYNVEMTNLQDWMSQSGVYVGIRQYDACRIKKFRISWELFIASERGRSSWLYLFNCKTTMYHQWDVSTKKAYEVLACIKARHFQGGWVSIRVQGHLEYHIQF